MALNRKVGWYSPIVVISFFIGHSAFANQAIELNRAIDASKDESIGFTPYTILCSEDKEAFRCEAYVFLPVRQAKADKKDASKVKSGDYTFDAWIGGTPQPEDKTLWDILFRETKEEAGENFLKIIATDLSEDEYKVFFNPFNKKNIYLINKFIGPKNPEEILHNPALHRANIQALLNSTNEYAFQEANKYQFRVPKDTSYMVFFQLMPAKDFIALLESVRTHSKGPKALELENKIKVDWSKAEHKAAIESGLGKLGGILPEKISLRNFAGILATNQENVQTHEKTDYLDWIKQAQLRAEQLSKQSQ